MGLHLDRAWGLRVLEALKRRFGPVRLRRRNAFKVLIATILSQHTTDVKAYEAYNRLAERFEISPKSLASAPLDEVAEAIRVAGLQHNKARAIVEVSRRLLSEEGFLKRVGGMGVEDARRMLMKLPGIGRKTADIVLLFSYGRSTFPIDTHIFRVSKRMGLRDKGEGYEKVRRRLQDVFPKDSYLEAHILLIKLGREVCKPRKTMCSKCPINSLCPKIV